MSKPSHEQIKQQIVKLRAFIDKNKDSVDECSEVKVRVAQIMEDTLRWATEDTNWKQPVRDIEYVE